MKPDRQKMLTSMDGPLHWGKSCGGLIGSQRVRRTLERTPRSGAQDDLAKVRAALHVAESLSDLAKREYAVHDRPHAVESDGPVHGLEHGSAADEDPLDAHIFHEHGRRVDLASPRKDPDQADAAAHPDRAQRFPERACAADLDDVIHAQDTGQLARAIAPLRHDL